jgi:hypothetical protein
MLDPLSDRPFVSAFGLTYNHEDYVADAIESVLAQDWPADRFEYVLIDDGSTDATAERVAPYRDRITFIRQENQGINASVNRAVGLLKGDVIVSCSGDDMWPERNVERVVECLRARPDVGFLYGDMEVIDAAGAVRSPSFMQSSGLQAHTGQIAGKLLSHNFVPGGSMAMRAALKPAMHPIPPDAAWEDWWFAWALTNVAPVDYVDEVLYRYRQHGENFVFGLRDRAKLLDRYADEVRFRRYMLGAVRPGTATLPDLGLGASRLVALVSRLVAGGRSSAEALTVTDGQGAAAEALVAHAVAVADSAPAVAGFAAARALGADPTNARALEVLDVLAGVPDVSPRELFDGVRSVRVFADVEELVGHPDLLAAYATAFGSADDVTLLALTHTWDYERLGAELAPFEALFESGDPPDVLASTCEEADWLNAVTRADCTLGPERPSPPGVRRFSDVGELRAFVEQRWRFPAYAP